MVRAAMSLNPAVDCRHGRGVGPSARAEREAVPMKRNIAAGIPACRISMIWFHRDETTAGLHSGIVVVERRAMALVASIAGGPLDLAGPPGTSGRRAGLVALNAVLRARPSFASLGRIVFS